jgi:hypothetical protein
MTTASLNPQPGTLNPSRWHPSGDDHLIFQWVKMEGKTQQNVASMFGINQSTVSRIIQRYERWQSHLKDRENGRLDPAERLRAQRWLTYERNELILASCLRIAGEMEGFTELSKSVTQYPTGHLADGRKIRTEERVTDRHGIASRFLRLAFRVNMEQLKLAEIVFREGEAPAEPLTDEEHMEELRQAAADAAEIAAARQRAADEVATRFGSAAGAGEASAEPHSVGWDQAAAAAAGPPSHSTEFSAPSTAASTAEPIPPADAIPPAPICNPQSPICNSPPALHNQHTEIAVEIAPTSTDPCSCVLEVRVEKNAPCACIIDCQKVGQAVPDWPAPLNDMPLAATLDQRTLAATP